MSGSNITKKALASSLKELMKKKDFSKINVGDICNLCGMNRTSFYYHFKDKYDLIEWILYTEFMHVVDNCSMDDFWGFLTEINNYFYKNRQFYISAFAIQGQNSFEEMFAEVFEPVMKQFLSSEVLNDEYCDFYCNYYIDASRCALYRWLKADDGTTPEEFVTLVKKIMYGTPLRISRIADYLEDDTNE